jgi:hypothetical protein
VESDEMVDTLPREWQRDETEPSFSREEVDDEAPTMRSPVPPPMPFWSMVLRSAAAFLIVLSDVSDDAPRSGLQAADGKRRGSARDL